MHWARASLRVHIRNGKIVQKILLNPPMILLGSLCEFVYEHADQLSSGIFYPISFQHERRCKLVKVQKPFYLTM